MPRPFRPLDNLDEAIRLYETGDRGFDAIALEMNVPRRVLRERLVERGTLRRRAVRSALVRANETRRNKRGLPEAEICAAYTAGSSENALAKQYGVSREWIKGILGRHGVERRGNTEANRAMMAERTPEENARNAEAAHVATRGSHRTFEQRCANATARHGKPPGSSLEQAYDHWLRERGIECIPQHAIGPYNCDLGASPVAVEIFGGHWHGSGHHAARFPERSQYILDQGWNLVIVWVNQARKSFSEAGADYIAAFIEESRRNPSLRGQYRVIWGDGQVVPTAGRQLNEFARVPARGSRKNAG